MRRAMAAQSETHIDPALTRRRPEVSTCDFLPPGLVLIYPPVAHVGSLLRDLAGLMCDHFWDTPYILMVPVTQTSTHALFIK